MEFDYKADDNSILCGFAALRESFLCLGLRVSVVNFFPHSDE